MPSLRPTARRIRSAASLQRLPTNVVRTEDKLPVRNISFERLSSKIKKPLIVKHFEKFGSVKYVKIMYGKTRSHPSKCIVCYKSPIAATAALKKSMHRINFEVAVVKACPSWEQPFEINEDPLDENNTTITTLTTPSSALIATSARIATSASSSCTSLNGINTILILNDYCLEMIYKKLDLLEQIRLSLCHERLENVYAVMICPRQIKSFSFEMIRGFTLWEIRQLFKTAGQYMRSFEIALSDCNSVMKHEATIYDFIKEYCVRVQRLQLKRRRFIFTNFLNVLNASHITELELYDCDVYDGDLWHLRVLKNLQTLGLARNVNIFGFKLCQLRNLQRLSLYGCERVTQANLLDICMALQLRFLDVRCMDGIHNWSIIIQHCVHIETLKISRVDCDGGEGPDSIARLPKLKRLDMQFFVRAMPTSFYDALVENHGNDLEELKITGNIYALFPTVAANIIKFTHLRVLWLGDNEYNSSKEFLKMIATLSDLEEFNLNYSIRIKGDHLLPILKNCTKLKYISLRFCRNISTDFVFKAISVLEKRVLSVPLLMLVGGTRVKRDILQDSRYQNAAHLLRLSFHVANAEHGYIEERNEFTLVEQCKYAVDNAANSDVVHYDSDDSDGNMYSYWTSGDSSDESDELDMFFWF